MKIASKASVYIVLFVLFAIITFVYILINNYFENQCLNSNGTAIYNEFGRFERCVRRR